MGAKLTIKEVLHRAKDIFHKSVNITTKNFGVILKAGSIIIIIEILAYMLAITLVISISYRRIYQNILLTIFTLPVTAYLSTGLFRFFLARIRQQDESLSMIFKYDPKFWKLLLYYAIYYAAYILIFKSNFFLDEYHIFVELRIIAGYILFIWIFIRLIFLPAIIMDQDLSLRDSLRHAVELTSRKFRRTLIMLLCIICILMAGLLNYLAGIIYAFPLTVIFYILFYENYNQEVEPLTPQAQKTAAPEKKRKRKK